MKSDFRKKIAGYTSLAGSIITLCSHAVGQIIYTDVPDIFLMTGDTANVDLNNDGFWEFHFSVGDYHPGVDGVIQVTLTGTLMHYADFKGHSCCTCGFYVYSVSALDTLEVISGNFDGDGNDNFLCNLDAWTCEDEWAGEIDKYMGIRMSDTASAYYGWIRLSVSPNCNGLIIKDWAYNTQPFNTILAGQKDLATGIGMDATSFEKLKIYSSGKMLFIKDNSERETLNLSIVNEVGEIQFQRQTDNVSASFNLSDLSPGIYFVIAKNPFQSVIEKIFIE